MPIEIEGVLGLDVTAADVRAALKDATSPVLMRINSPGGDVHEGIAIANALRDFRRNGGEVYASVVGLAASMASYVAMFADRVAVEDNAVWMTHNPWSVAIGDHRTMAKAATVLESLRGILSRAYASKTGRDAAEVLQEMDAETWLYGKEIVEAGYADDVVVAGDGPDDKLVALAIAQAAFGAMRSKIKERDADAAHLDRIAAMILPAPSPDQQGDPKMSEIHEPEPMHTPPADTEAEHAAAIAAAVALERKRVVDIQHACAAARMPELAAKLIEDGTSVDRAREILINAMADKSGPEMRAAPQIEDDGEENFEAVLASKVKTGMSRLQAMRATIAERPDLHQEWLAKINQTRRRTHG